MDLGHVEPQPSLETYAKHTRELERLFWIHFWLKESMENILGRSDEDVKPFSIVGTYLKYTERSDRRFWTPFPAFEPMKNELGNRNDAVGSLSES